MKNPLSRRLFLTAAIAVTLAGCATAEKATDLVPLDTKPDIVDTAVAAGPFKTLVAAVQAAGLVDTLKGEGPFTVFAPTDDAFAKLPAGALDRLLEPANKEQLQSILTYHVVAGQVMSADLLGKTTDAATVNGQSVSIDALDGVKVNNAKVVSADIEAGNGVIHVIDTVLLPR